MGEHLVLNAKMLGAMRMRHGGVCYEDLFSPRNGSALREFDDCLGAAAHKPPAEEAAAARENEVEDGVLSVPPGCPSLGRRWATRFWFWYYKLYLQARRHYHEFESWLLP